MSATLDLGSCRFRHATRRGKVAFWGTVLLSVVAMMVAIPSEALWKPLGAALLLGGIVGMLASAGVAARAFGFREGRVHLDDRNIMFEDAVLPRSAIRAAIHVPTDGIRPGRVELQGVDGDPLGSVELDEARAAQLIDALGASAAQGGAEFRAITPGWSAAARWSLLAMVLGAVEFTFGCGMASPLLATAGGILALATPLVLAQAKIRVGADGLMVKTPGGRRFLAWNEVREIGPSHNGVILDTTSGQVRVALYPTFSLSSAQKETQAALIEKARQALRDFRARGTTSIAERLARRGRPLEEWLRGLKNFEGDFRNEPVSADELLQVVEDPHQDTTARAAAAAALGSRGSSGDRERIRIAADACAGERLRVALTRAADGSDEEAVNEALSALDEEAAERAARRIEPTD
ncbi:MAG: hypothetical protein HOV80_31755 [Polyangiaceae bacterium]|nr:hypothetical protein [Polyangiaceae bacterium]